MYENLSKNNTIIRSHFIVCFFLLFFWVFLFSFSFCLFWPFRSVPGTVLPSFSTEFLRLPRHFLFRALLNGAPLMKVKDVTETTGKFPFLFNPCIILIGGCSSIAGLNLAPLRTTSFPYMSFWGTSPHSLTDRTILEQPLICYNLPPNYHLL